MTSITATMRSGGLRAWQVRLMGGLIALFFAVPLVIGARLEPNERGEGTHTQLGLPACSTMKFTGWPCPSCGWTTAFAWTMHGRPDKAVLVQPVGAMLSIGFMVGVLVGVQMVWSGRNNLGRFGGLLSKQSIFWMCVIVLLGWAYKAALVKGVL